MTQLPHPQQRRSQAAFPAFHRRSRRGSRDQALATLSVAKRQMRGTRRLIRQIAAGQVAVEDLETVLLRKIHAGFADIEADSRASLLQLFLHVERCSDLLTTARGSSRLGPRPSNTLTDGLIDLARHHASWQRPPRTWRPDSRHQTTQFHQLARHLLARYDVPAFMDIVWFLGDGEQARTQQGWFVHIGTGGNIRTATHLPLHLTKRMAHHFLQAPPESTVGEALRWGQIIGQGGDPELVSAVVQSRLGRSFENEEFWSTVISFLVRQRGLDLSWVSSIVDYLHHRKFETQQIPQPDGSTRGAPPPEPNLSMKSRSLPKLLGQVGRWRGNVAATPPPFSRREAMRRRRFGHFDYEDVDESTGRTIRWTIHELTTPRSLAVEGEAMSHCAGDYRDRLGQISVWSMQAQEGECIQRILTISIDIEKRLVTQVAGRFNTIPESYVGLPPGAIDDHPGGRIPPSERELLRKSNGILRLWLDRERLAYSTGGD